jgi:hypothetical protein
LRRLTLFVVFCLAALPLWADYGLSNVVTKQIDRTQVNQQVPAVPGKAASQAEQGKVVPPAPTQIPEAAAPDKKPSQTAVQFKKTVFYPYTIHISSWQNKKDALSQYKQKFQKLDGAFVTKIDLGVTGVWYRIDFGTFSTSDEANARMRDLQAQGTIDTESFVGSSVPYAIEIGVYASRAEAAKAGEKLRDGGVVPYIMKETDAFRLLAGAFPSSKSAYPALEDITALGLQSKIAKR